MDDDCVMETPVNNNGNDWYHCNGYDIPPTFSGFLKKLSYDKKTSHYYEESSSKLSLT